MGAHNPLLEVVASSYNSNNSKGSWGKGHGQSLPPNQFAKYATRMPTPFFSAFISLMIAIKVKSSTMQVAYTASPSQGSDFAWYSEIGTTHHINSDIANLNVKAKEYTGSNHIQMGTCELYIVDHFPRMPLRKKELSTFKVAIEIIFMY